MTSKDLIKKYEGLKLTSYLCPAGVPTIGWVFLQLDGVIPMVSS